MSHSNQPDFITNQTGKVISKNNFINQNLVDSGTSRDMNVDGSSVPVSFGFTVPIDGSFTIHKIWLYIENNSNFDSTSFGSITALTNGLQLLIAGVEQFNFKDNLDITGFFDTEEFDYLSTLGRQLYAPLYFKNPIILGSQEVVSFNVRDNLSSQNIIRSGIYGTLNN